VELGVRGLSKLGPAGAVIFERVAMDLEGSRDERRAQESGRGGALRDVTRSVGGHTGTVGEEVGNANSMF